MNVDDFLQRLRGVKKRGRGRWSALCPVHEEKHGSVSITEKHDGKILAYCWGCGASFPDICKAIGYEYRSAGWIEGERGDRTPSGAHSREVARALKDELSVSWVLLTDVANSRVFSKDDRERARVCARRCAAMIEELSA